MGFWGTEVKPGKPFTFNSDESNGRLHISMATLGSGTANKKSILQCNVGKKSPVYLCSLYPEKSESLQLHLEFEETDEVIFSVLGPRSVHLAGYYLGGSRRYNPDESESFGEDIADSETPRSVNSDEDQYDSSFINDDDPKVIPSSPASDAGDSDLESEEEFKVKKKPHRNLLLRRNLLLSDSEDEDDDVCPISSLYKKKLSTMSTTQQVEENAHKGTVDTSKKTVDDAASSKSTDNVGVDGQLERKIELSTSPTSSRLRLGDEERPDRKVKEQVKEKNSLEADVIEKEDAIKKEDETAEKSLDLFVEQGQQPMRVDHCGAEMLDNLSIPSIEAGLGNGDRPKKKRKKRKESKTSEVNMKEDKGAHDEAKGEFCPDVSVKGEQHQKAVKEIVDEPDEKRGKKKKRKTHSAGEALNTDVALLSAEEKITSPVQNEVNNANAKSSEVGTFPSQLIIEELEAGKPDGKVATSGKKIKVHYVGKLKENGVVVVSSGAGSPAKFRLGRGKVIQGLDSGIDGMRVGGKRRLVVPPSMAYGSEGDGKDIPSDSWLICDVELVKVH